MPLFRQIKTIAQYITIADAVSDASLPKQVPAEEEYIIPVLGQALFTTLQTEADGNLTTPSALIKKAWAALAFLCYYDELPLMHARISDSGLKNVTNDKIQGAYRYQYEAVRSHCEDQGLAALERLFVFLLSDPNASYYTAWKASDAYKRLNKNLIKSGTDFSTYYHIYQPHRTFHCLQPILTEAEDLFITPTIGEAFFIELRDKATPSTDEKYVLELLKKAAANLTIFKSVGKLTVRLRAEGLTVMLSPTGHDRADQGEENAPTSDKGRLEAESFKDGNEYLNRAVNYLNAKASNSVFATYFTSSLYKNPATTVKDINDCMEGIFVM